MLRSYSTVTDEVKDYDACYRRQTNSNDNKWTIFLVSLIEPKTLVMCRCQFLVHGKYTVILNQQLKIKLHVQPALFQQISRAHIQQNCT